MKVKINSFKAIKYVLFAITIISLQSCNSTYYQVYQVNSIDTKKNIEGNFFHKSDDCYIIYSMWCNGGNSGFQFYNNTDSTIYINLKETFFICNDRAYDYYLNREATHVKGNSASSSLGVSSQFSVGVDISLYGYIFHKADYFPAKVGASGSISEGKSENKSYSEHSSNGVTIRERDIVAIPPRSYKIISEYAIFNDIIRTCDQKELFPRKKISRSFLQNNTPIKFGNYITYSFDSECKENKVIENNFWISEISNYNEKEALIKSYDDNCGKRMNDYNYKFKSNVSGLDKFYNKYR